MSLKKYFELLDEGLKEICEDFEASLEVLLWAIDTATSQLELTIRELPAEKIIEHPPTILHEDVYFIE